MGPFSKPASKEKVFDRACISTLNYESNQWSYLSGPPRAVAQMLGCLVLLTTFIILSGCFCCWLVAASKCARGTHISARYVFEWSNLAQELRRTALRPGESRRIARRHELRLKPFLLLLGRSQVLQNAHGSRIHGQVTSLNRPIWPSRSRDPPSSHLTPCAFLMCLTSS